MDILIHAANVLYLVAYVIRDILWLRVFTVIAASCLTCYLYFLPEPLLTAVYWNLLFILLNLYSVGRLIIERRPMRPNQKERGVHTLVRDGLAPGAQLSRGLGLAVAATNSVLRAIGAADGDGAGGCTQSSR